MKVKIKKLHPDAIIPKYQTKGAAGFDLHVVETVCLNPQVVIAIKTGLAIKVPEGYELQVRPRSGFSLKQPYLRIVNSPGTIDSDFTGEICVIMQNLAPSKAIGDFVHINKGDRIAQGIIAPIVQAEFEEVDELKATERGSKGWGSTGMGCEGS
jgi:dUTP pyrophosphatase